MNRTSAAWILLALLTGCGGSLSIPPTDQPAFHQDPSPEEFLLPSAGTATASATDHPTPGSTPAFPTATQPTTATLERKEKISLAFVGDIMLGRSLGARIGRGEGDSIFASVEGILQSADLAIGNLECALGEGGTPAPKAYTFLAPPEAAGLLGNAGFDLLSLANNHSLDYGHEVFGQTRNLLTQNGIRYVGAGSDESGSHAPAWMEIGGRRIAFLAYADVQQEYLSKFDTRTWTAGLFTPGIAWADDDTIKQDLESLEGSADLIVVLFHFGTEGMALPDKRQGQLARLAVDSGADLVIGTHPHVVQSAEQYEGVSNKSAILWITFSGGEAPAYSLMPLIIVDGIPRIGE
jgi:poly-gamma-glutamate capsule biosynthesis protein CapA/YwtB (metallophosphatase superfamily)